jgi:hypothetical protein
MPELPFSWASRASTLDGSLHTLLATTHAIEERRGDLLTRNVIYQLSILANIGSYGDEELREGVLLLPVDAAVVDT